VPARLAQLDVGTPCFICHVLDVLGDEVQLASLLMHDMRDIPEQLVQLAHALLDVSYLSLALDDQRLLEVDLILVCESRLLELLLLLLGFRGWRGKTGFIKGGPGSDCRGTLLL